MNEKRKILSLFLCLALLFSTLATTLVSAEGFNPETVAVATGETTVTVTTSGELDEDDEYMPVYVRFTPEVSGWYIIYSDSDSDPYANLCDSTGYSIDYSDDEVGMNFQFYYEFEAGESYFVRIRDYEGESTFDVIFDQVDENEVWIGKVFTSGDLEYKIIDDDSVEVLGYVDNFKTPTDLSTFTLEIPAEVEGMRVTTIDTDAFCDCDFTSVTISENINDVNIYAFNHCKSLASINVDSKNETYSSIDGVLFNKDKTELIKYPEAKTNASYTIPDSVTYLFYNAFESNASLTSVTIPGSVTTIHYCTFYNCDSLKTVTMLEGVKNINSEAFAYCDSLENITIPKSVTSIYENAFDYSGYYNNKDNWENGVLYIGDCLIQASSGFELDLYDEKEDRWYEEYIPEVDKDYTIKNGTRLIANRAFSWCENLENVTIPESVANIGYSAFYATDYYNNEDNWENNVLYNGDCLIEARCDQVDEWYDEEDDEYYEEIIPGLNGDYEIKAGTRVIADDAFFECEITSVKIPSSVRHIGNYAFSECYSLKKIEILSSVANIGEEALGHGEYKEDFVIYGYDESTAQQYATENEIDFVVLEHKHTGLVTKEPTCIEAGSKLINCECGYSGVEEIPSIGHKEEVVAGKAPTCTETGLTEGKKCSYCSAITVAQTEIPALGHKEEVVAGKAATCTETGLTEGKKCSVCNEILVKQETIAVLSHTLTVKNAKEATYFANGYTGDSVCIDCGATVASGKAIAKLKLAKPKFNVKKVGKKIKVTCKKVNGATNFEVRYKAKGKWKIKTFSAKNNATKFIKNLKKGKYKVQVRAVVKQGKLKAFSKWTISKKIKIK